MEVKVICFQEGMGVMILKLLLTLRVYNSVQVASLNLAASSWLVKEKQKVR